MGANRGHVAAIILNEATLLSAAGGAAGILLGYVLLFSFKNLMLHYLRLPYLFPSTPELITLTAGALFFAIVTGLLAAFLPSITILKVEPYEAIRSAE
jgi:putative ABC transport system permease protein